MKNFLEVTLGCGFGAVGCMLYVIFYGVCLVVLLLVGFKVLSWIF
jgi:hypothetical protein